MSDVRVTDLEARATAVLAATTTWGEYPDLWRRLLDQVHAAVTWPPGTRIGRNVMLYLSDEPSVEVGVLLEAPAEVAPPVVRSSLPGGRVATYLHVGPYERLGEAHDLVRAFCAERGLELAGPCWEVYGHAKPVDPETEVTYLLV